MNTEWRTGDFNTTTTPDIGIIKLKTGIKILFLTGQNE